jgi:hypothetical protein
MGLYGDAPEQKDYGEATAETIQAQYDFITGTGQFEGKGLIDMLPAEIKARGEYQDAEMDLLTRQLLGEVIRFDEDGRAQTGTRRVAVDPEALGGYEMREVSGNRWGLYKDGQYTGHQSGIPADLSQFVDEPHRGAFQQQLVEGTEFTEEPVYIEGKPGTIASREGGALDLYGGNTRVKQFNQAKYQENLDAGMGEEEARKAATTWGTAGFDPETGEFKGLIPMMQEAQAYITSQQRESDISDVEALGDRATEAIRSQGDIQEVLDNIERQVAANEAGVDPLRKQLLTRANELANAQLSDKEKHDLGQLIDARSARSGKIRDRGAERDYVQGIMEADWNRGMQGALAGGQLMAGESAIQTNLLGQLMTRLGAEQATSADPLMAILGRPSQSAPTAQSVLSTGAGLMAQSGPEYINPESGLPYISNQYTNEANMYAADKSATASMVGGVFGGVGDLLGGDWFKFGKKKGGGEYV